MYPSNFYTAGGQVQYQRHHIDGGVRRTRVAFPRPADNSAYDSGVILNDHQSAEPRRNYFAVVNPVVQPTYRPAAVAAPLQQTTNAAVTIRTKEAVYVVLKTIQSPPTDDDHMSQGIYLIRHPDGTRRIEKRLRMTDNGRTERAEAEKSALQQIADAGGSPNINQIYEAFWPRGSPYCSLILEHCDNESLNEHILLLQRRRLLINENLAWHIIRDVAAALSMCHSGVRDPLSSKDKVNGWNTICHLDIKPANVFISSKRAPGQENPHFPRFVLGDFGCAVTNQHITARRVDPRLQPFGTFGWFPPETNVERNGTLVGEYGWKSDIWQMGGLVQVMCRQSINPDMSKVAVGRPCSDKFSPELNKIVSQCMAANPRSRPTAIDVARQVKVYMDQRGTGI